VFKHGDAEFLPFADEEFDGVVTRLAIHHFAEPQRALDEMFRVLQRGGSAVVVDVISSEDVAESNLHNAIERLRDPSHVRMLPASVLSAFLTNAGFRDIETATWDMGPRTGGMAGDCQRSVPGRTDPHHRSRRR
jgi:SAM-dependent methyltransferase